MCSPLLTLPSELLPPSRYGLKCPRSSPCSTQIRAPSGRGLACLSAMPATPLLRPRVSRSHNECHLSPDLFFNLSISKQSPLSPGRRSSEQRLRRQGPALVARRLAIARVPCSEPPFISPSQSLSLLIFLNFSPLFLFVISLSDQLPLPSIQACDFNPPLFLNPIALSL